MMIALAALFSSAFACGPYGTSVVSEEGSFALDNGSFISLYNADGSYAEIPVEGELIDMDFVGEDLVVAFGDAHADVVVLFGSDGEELADWIPRRTNLMIRSIDVLARGLVVNTSQSKERVQVYLTDDLRRARAPRLRFTGGW